MFSLSHREDKFGSTADATSARLINTRCASLTFHCVLPRFLLPTRRSVLGGGGGGLVGGRAGRPLGGAGTSPEAAWCTSRRVINTSCWHITRQHHDAYRGPLVRVMLLGGTS